MTWLIIRVKICIYDLPFSHNTFVSLIPKTRSLYDGIANLQCLQLLTVSQIDPLGRRTCSGNTFDSINEVIEVNYCMYAGPS